jgi:DNA-binding LytR/AlgR family response regulator
VAALKLAPYPLPSRALPLVVVFVLAGALLAAAFAFGLIYVLRRTGSSLTLASLAAVAGLQAILESLRTLMAYSYPVHGWRLIGIWGLTAVFALLLVSWTVSRFWPKGRRPVMCVALALIPLTALVPGFDYKTAFALMTGLVLSAVTAGYGVRKGLPASRLTLGWLILFIAAALTYPAWLVDLSYFLFAAAFLLPLMMSEVVRQGRDDRQREVALTRAVSRPDCLTVTSSRGVERVPLADIIAVLGADDYVELRLTDGRSLLHAARLDRLEADLPAPFLRIHRSVIASLTHARSLERSGGRSRLLMQDGTALPISRNRLPTTRGALEGAGS